MLALRRSVALLIVLMGFATASLADDEFVDPSRWSYRTEAGILLPSAKASPRLEMGPHVLGAIDFEMNRAFYMGTDVSYGVSGDELGTRIASLGVHARISPAYEFTTFYVIASLGAYRAYYDHDRPDLPAPSDRLRPGASFGFGYDLGSFSKFTVTSTAAFQGLFTRGNAGRNIALEYFTARLGLWYRPSGP
jgi:hypothetical protein